MSQPFFWFASQSRQQDVVNKLYLFSLSLLLCFSFIVVVLFFRILLFLSSSWPVTSPAKREYINTQQKEQNISTQSRSVQVGSCVHSSRESICEGGLRESIGRCYLFFRSTQKLLTSCNVHTNRRKYRRLHILAAGWTFDIDDDS